jgi:hypothetical protein
LPGGAVNEGNALVIPAKEPSASHIFRWTRRLGIWPKFDSLIFYVLEPQADRLGADFFTTRFLWG